MGTPHGYQTPIERQVLNLQEIAHRTGWHQGKRENLMWAIITLRNNGYPDAADYLETLIYGFRRADTRGTLHDKALPRVQSPTGFQSSQYQASNQTTKVETPGTAVEWPSEKPGGTHASHDSTK